MDVALKCSSTVTFVLNTDIMTIDKTVDKLRAADKLIFVHVDLMSGISRDASGINFLAERIGIDGIVTTRSSLIPIAKQHGLMAVQRTFIFDSVSVDQTIKTMSDSRPDATEVLPGLVIPHVIKTIQRNRNARIIAGGLLSTKQDVRAVLDSGCIGISTSSASLWKWQDNGFKN